MSASAVTWETPQVAVIAPPTRIRAGTGAGISCRPAASSRSAHLSTFPFLHSNRAISPMQQNARSMYALGRREALKRDKPRGYSVVWQPLARERLECGFMGNGSSGSDKAAERAVDEQRHSFRYPRVRFQRCGHAVELDAEALQARHELLHCVCVMDTYLDLDLVIEPPEVLELAALVPSAEVARVEHHPAARQLRLLIEGWTERRRTRCRRKGLAHSAG